MALAYITAVDINVVVWSRSLTNTPMAARVHEIPRAIIASGSIINGNANTLKLSPPWLSGANSMQIAILSEAKYSDAITLEMEIISSGKTTFFTKLGWFTIRLGAIPIVSAIT